MSSLPAIEAGAGQEPLSILWASLAGVALGAAVPTPNVSDVSGGRLPQRFFYGPPLRRGLGCSAKTASSSSPDECIQLFSRLVLEFVFILAPGVSVRIGQVGCSKHL